MGRLVLALALAFAVLAWPGSEAAAKSDSLASTTAKARQDFAAGVRDVERQLTTATASIEKQFRTGAIGQVTAATNYGNAFAFLVKEVKKLADTAAAAVTTGASAKMAAAADPSLRGALAGDGGSLDLFGEQMQASIDAARRRALARARRFAKLLSASGNRAAMEVVLAPWPFERRAAPVPVGVRAPADEPIRLLAAFATRADGGEVVVTLIGSAPESLDGKFDARLRSGTQVRAVGGFLSAGGMAVSEQGTWSATSTLNNPELGEDEPVGNRVVEFGVEPFDGGLAGQQPGRFQHGGVIGVP